MTSKVIVSHDVDHIYSWHHYNNTIIPKFMIRGLIECGRGKIPVGELLLRYGHTITGKWQFIEELSEFNRENNVNCNWFFAAANGLGLEYSTVSAKPYLKKLESNGDCIGIHGIERTGLGRMTEEKKRFENEYGIPCSGIRFHYLYPNDRIFCKLRAVGYSYDSSLRGEGSARLYSGLAHFPVHVMDVDMIQCGSRMQSVSTERAIEATKSKLSSLVEKRTNFISILFHDRYFSLGHRSWQDWYVGVIRWVNEQGLETTSYENATKALLSST